MKTFKNAFFILFRNTKSIILFEISYKLLCLAVFSPVLYGLFNLSLHLAGYRYLSAERLFSYLTSPSTILLLFFILIALTAVSLLEMGAMIQCFHASYHNCHIHVTEMFSAGLYTMLKLIRGNNFLLIFFVVLVIPFTNLTVISGYIGSITLPAFVTEYIFENRWLEALTIAGFLLLYFFALRWGLSIHCFVLEPGNYMKASSRSKRLVSHNYIRHIFCILGWNLMVLLCVIVIAVILSGGSFFFIKLFLPEKIDYSAALQAVRVILAVILELYSIFSIPLTFSYLSSLYYTDCEKQGDLIPAYRNRKVTRLHLQFSRLLLSLVLGACFLLLTYAGLSRVIDPFRNQNILGTTQITAHRGDSVAAPENTLPAFELAIDDMADCIELDVAETKDGVIVVMHDSNLKRITGNDIDIWNLTYEELKNYDAGAWFDSSFTGTAFPTLAEVMEVCKYRIDLNIELKPTGHETNYEENVLSVIYENNYEHNCVIASSDRTALKHIKSLDDTIPTIYIMQIAYGDFAEMDFADGFSIEASSITASLVNQIHDSGKVIYAWTVNDERRLHQMLRLNVDNIVTDNPVSARVIQNTQDMSSTLTTYIRELFP